MSEWICKKRWHCMPPFRSIGVLAASEPQLNLCAPAAHRRPPIDGCPNHESRRRRTLPALHRRVVPASFPVLQSGYRWVGSGLMSSCCVSSCVGLDSNVIHLVLSSFRLLSYFYHLLSKFYGISFMQTFPILVFYPSFFPVIPFIQ